MSGSFEQVIPSFFPHIPEVFLDGIEGASAPIAVALIGAFGVVAGKPTSRSACKTSTDLCTAMFDVIEHAV